MLRPVQRREDSSVKELAKKALHKIKDPAPAPDEIPRLARKVLDKMPE